MQSTITKWGNSLALRLPRNVAEAARLSDGSPVKIEVADGMITISRTRARYRLEDLLKGEPAPAYAWGAPTGGETW